jgi:hypothetical protein
MFFKKNSLKKAKWPKADFLQICLEFWQQNRWMYVINFENAMLLKLFY